MSQKVPHVTFFNVLTRRGFVFYAALPFHIMLSWVSCFRFLSIPSSMLKTSSGKREPVYFVSYILYQYSVVCSLVGRL